MDGLISIVLVDDAPDVRALVRARLQLAKRFDIVGEGGTGAEAVELVRRTSPALLLLDVSMPDMDGLDALQRVREMAPGTRVVMFSGFEEHGLADRARELGAVAFIEKSMPIAEVVDQLIALAPGASTRPPAPSAPDEPAIEPVLQEHLERFRAAFDQAAIGMATLTLTGRIVRANEALAGLLGPSPAELVGMPFEALLGRTSPEELTKSLAEVAAGTRDVASVEHDLRAGGVVVSTVAVVRDSARRPLYLFLQVQDVTEQRLAEEELRRSEERFRLLVEGVQDYAIFMLDPGGHIISWNAGAQRAKGYTEEEILGQHFSVFYLQEAIDRDHPQHELEIAIAEGRYEEEGWRKRKDGTTFWANVLITAIYDRKGNHVGFAKVTRDVTERRRLLQELEQAAAERTQILAVTAHELRTPVSVINGFASTLQDHWDDLPDGDRRDMVDSLHRAGLRLGRLVEDLFTAARLESGALEVRPSDFDLALVVREAISDLPDDGVVLASGPMLVHADRGRVQQMVSNYLTNALRYGAPPITVTLSERDGMAELAVTDAGPGVREELQDRLFGKFATGGSKESTGLGLFIVRELARAQGGDAWYAPGEAGGASFRLRLPLPEATTA